MTIVYSKTLPITVKMGLLNLQNAVLKLRDYITLSVTADAIFSLICLVLLCILKYIDSYLYIKYFANFYKGT